VLVEQPGIRNYRKRLDALRKKNPFEQQFEIQPEETSVAVDDAGGSTTVGDPSISLAGSADTATSDPAPSDTTTTSTASSPAGDPSVSLGSTPAAAPSSVERRTEVREVETVISYAIDVEAGRAGRLEPHEAVERFEPLPSKHAPVVIYVGASEDAKRAAFLVSRDVTETKGGGTCVRSRSGECSLLRMKVGEAREFFYGPDAERFRLKLRSIVAVEESAGK